MIKRTSSGLPEKVIYCSECNLSNQNPTSTNEYFHTNDIIQDTVDFDENNICAACNFNKLKWNNVIDWEEREKELIEICNQYRKDDGSYDCLVGGSGGKDSVYQSHVLKYKYGMNPLTITWAPHLYTDIGFKNFQNWLHIGGFDNFLYTPNGKIHKLLTRNAFKNLCHPFQPFIMGQKTLAIKMANRFNIPIIFDGEMPGEYGRKVSHKVNQYNSVQNKKFHSQVGFSTDVLEGKDFLDTYLGGIPVKQYLEDGIPLVELKSYAPLETKYLEQKPVEFHYLGYYLRWVPQECYYYAVENTNFEANPERTEGTYSKYNSLDDKTDGFFYYTRFIKFGIGRAMLDSAQEIRNSHLTKEEGLALIDKFDGEFPERYAKEFLDYIDMERDEFNEICDKFRQEHIWKNDNDKWSLKVSPKEYFKNQE